MSERGTPGGQREDPEDQGLTASGIEDDQTAAGLQAALAEISQVARGNLAAQTPEHATEDGERSPNPLYGVNMQRGAEFDDLADVDESLFEPRGAAAGVDPHEALVTPQAVEDEVDRLRTEYRNAAARRRTTIFRTDPGRNWAGSFGGARTHPPMGSGLRGIQRTLFNDNPEAARMSSTAAAGTAAAEPEEDGTREQPERLREMIAREVERSLEALLPPPALPGQQRASLRPGERGDARRVYLDVGLALKSIPEFDGSDAAELDGFIQACESVWGLIKPMERPILLTLVRSGKIRGKATREMRHKQIGTFRELKKEMESLYAQRKSLSVLQFEFSQLQQGAKESVSTYAARVEKLTVEMVEKLCEGEEQHGSRYIERATRRSAQSAFENGLSREIQLIVRSRNYGSLHDSVVGALEVEKMVAPGGGKNNSHGGQPKVSLGAGEATAKKCFTCGEAGHIARDCQVAGVPGRRSLPAPAPSRQVNMVRQACHYCGKTGHFWRDCRARLRDEAEKKTPPGGRQEGERTSVAEGTLTTVGAFDSRAKANAARGNQIREICVIRATSGEEPKTVKDFLEQTRAGIGQSHEICVVGTAVGGTSDFHIKSPTSPGGMLTMKADTGAQVSLISARAIHNGTKATRTMSTLSGLGGFPIPVLCEAEVTLETPTASVTHNFHVVPEGVSMEAHGILGMDFIRKHEVSILGGREIEIYGHRMPLLDEQGGKSNGREAVAGGVMRDKAAIEVVPEVGNITTRVRNYDVCLINIVGDGGERKHPLGAPGSTVNGNHGDWKRYTIAIDVTEREIRAVLSQGETEDQLSQHASRVMSTAEKNYERAEQELLAIMCGIGQFHNYICATKFTIIADSRALAWLHGMARPKLRHERWKAKLSEYEYNVVYARIERNLGTDIPRWTDCTTEPRNEVDDSIQRGKGKPAGNEE